MPNAGGKTKHPAAEAAEVKAAEADADVAVVSMRSGAAAGVAAASLAESSVTDLV